MSSKLGENSMTFKKVTYVQKSSPCLSFTVNSNQSLLYIRSYAKFIILQLFSRMGQIKKLGLLLGENEYVDCLLFMKNSNQFITAGVGSKILVWTFDKKQGWQISEQLQGHNHLVSCLHLNKQEDLLISGSLDKTVKIWNRRKKWQCQQTIDVNQDQVVDINLNQAENTLVVCGLPDTIIVLKYFQSEQIWSIIQKIESGAGIKLYFLNNYTFVFQQELDNFIRIFKQNEQDQQFKLIMLIDQFESYYQFPIIYAQRQNLLLIKTGTVVNLMKYTDQEEFQVLQQIEFNTQGIGTISENARYLITWEEDELFEEIFFSNEIKIRMLKQFN